MVKLKYSAINNIIKDGSIITSVIPERKIPVTYIDILDILKQTSGKIETLPLTEKDEELIEKYLEGMPGPKMPLNYLLGDADIGDIFTPELLQMSELPLRAVKRKGYVIGANVFTSQVDKNEIHTSVHYSVIDEHGGEIESVIINDFLIAPERAKTASRFDEALRNHEHYKYEILKIIRNL